MTPFHSFTFTARALALGAICASTMLAGLAVATPARADDDGDDDYQIVNVQTSIVANNLKRTVATVQVGDNPTNRFQMYRVRRANVPASGEALLLMPPASIGFENYEITADGDYADSFAGFFAKRGYDVWGMSQRAAQLHAGDCESGVADCSVMADWGLQTLVEDATFVRGRIKAADPWARAVVGGVSLGSIAAVAVINAHPHKYVGALMLEGALVDDEPAEHAINEGFCGQLEGLLDSGVYYDDQQLPGLKMIAQLASADPSGPSPIPGFAPGLTNHQTFVAVMSTPQISPLTPRPDYFFTNGDVAQDRLFFASDRLALNNILQFSDYIPLRTERDINCSLAGETTFTGNLHKFKGDVFVAADEHGFGTTMLDTVQRMPKASVTVQFAGNYGHMDYFFNAEQRKVMLNPILHWLDKSVFNH